MDKPANAYELCERVCEAIELAPQNYYQGAFAMSVAHVLDDQGKGKEVGEACGTAFCRAGWMCAIMDDKTAPRSSAEWEGMNLSMPATKFLHDAGISMEEIGALFDGDSNISAEYGTIAYTRQGIAGMKRFMHRHKTKLLAHSTEKWIPPAKWGY